MPHPQPYTSHAIGSEAEDIAASYLLEHGYVLLERNVRYPVGEIDIVAHDGDVLCFVEVRARRNTDHGHPLETIGPQKIRRIIRAAEAYLHQFDNTWPTMRFDALGIVLRNPPTIDLVKGAFEA